MKYIISLLVMVLFCGFINNAVLAQEEEEEAHVFVVTALKAAIPDDGSEAERDSLLTELYNAQKSNQKVLSHIEMRHLWGSDSRDWVVITEYATFADIEEAGKINQDLNKKRWPDEKERDAFFERLFEYFPQHSDEIYTEIPQFRK